jgi:hypothetical protein
MLQHLNAALPPVAGLIEKGMAPGTLDLVCGGVWAVARPPVFAACLGIANIGALLAGLAFTVAG